MNESYLAGKSGYFASKDSDLYESYGKLINASYPALLMKLGLKNVAVRAEGATITDSEGRTYIDCVGGYGLHNLGHNHPTVIQALIEQIKENQLLARPLISEIQVRLAEYLSEVIQGDLKCSFICNSGSEAIDTAIKLARLSKGRKKIIAMENSFHGYTMGALSASGIPSFKRIFEPLVPDIFHIPFGDPSVLERLICKETAAILLEPIQHEAGVYLPPPDYLRRLRKICNDHGVLLIFDEVKTGCGKTGQMFAYYHYGTEPDVLVLGKSLGGGLFPIGAVIAKTSLWKKFSMSFSMSASSYAGNTLACKAALTTMKILHDTNLIPECAEKGKTILLAIQKCVERYPDVLRDVKGLGLLIGVVTVNSQICFELAKQMIKEGIIALPAYGNASVLMIEPPLVITSLQIEKVLEALDKACCKLSHCGG